MKFHGSPLQAVEVFKSGLKSLKTSCGQHELTHFSSHLLISHLPGTTLLSVVVSKPAGVWVSAALSTLDSDVPFVLCIHNRADVL